VSCFSCFYRDRVSYKNNYFTDNSSAALQQYVVAPSQLLAEEKYEKVDSFEIFLAGCGGQSSSQTSAYYYFSLGKLLEHERQLSLALQAYQSATKCDISADKQFLLNKIWPLEIWLGDFQGNPELIERYLLEETTSLPQDDIIAAYRLLESDSYRMYSEAKLVCLALQATSKEELINLTGETLPENFSLAKMQHKLKTSLWEVIMSYCQMWCMSFKRLSCQDDPQPVFHL